MPNKSVTEVINRLISVEGQLRTHLIEGTGIKTDIIWLKWLMMLVIAGIMSLWLKG